MMRRGCRTGLPSRTRRQGGVLTLQRTRPGVSQSPERLLSSRQLGYSGVWLWDAQSLVTVANSMSANSGSDLA